MTLGYDASRDHRDMDQSPQVQPQQPGIETDMEPRPQYIDPSYRGSGKLEGKVALITGGDSGIGRAVAVHFALEGADVAINYLSDHELDPGIWQARHCAARRCGAGAMLPRAGGEDGARTGTAGYSGQQRRAAVSAVDD